jgi:chromosome segregation ATPase
MVRIEELEQQVREIGSEIESEKQVTRRMYEQAVRTAEQVGALRSEVGIARVDIHAVGSQVDLAVVEVVQVSGAVRTHGIRLESLTRDIGLLRNDATELRRGQEEIHVRLDRHEERLNALQGKVDALHGEFSRKFDTLHGTIDTLYGKFDTLHGKFDTLQGAVDTLQGDINHKLDALIAAVTPHGPAP